MPRVPTYPLAEIKAQFATSNGFVISGTAHRTSVALGMSQSDIVDVIQNLSVRNLYKVMRGNVDPRIMHDVYKSEWNGIPLYIKFIRNHGEALIMLVSCKEDESHV